MPSTNAQMILLALVFVLIAIILSDLTHRYKVRKRIEYNDHLLNRRDNFLVGDLDVDRSE